MTTPLPQFEAATTGEQRRRDSLFLLARLRLDGGKTFDVRVRNLSEGGTMAELDPAPPIDTAVVLDLRGIGEVGGRVAWCESGRIGIAFDRPIDPKAARKPVRGGDPALGRRLKASPRP